MGNPPPYQQESFTIAVPTGRNFLHSHPAYRSCCCHVKTAATVAGSVSVVLGALVLLAACGLAYKSNLNATWVELSWSITNIVTGAIVIAGVKKTNRKLLIPFLLWQVGQILLLLIGMSIIIALNIMIFSDLHSDDFLPAAVEKFREKRGSNRNSMIAGAAVVLSLMTLYFSMTVYFVVAVQRCYSYLRDKRSLGHLNSVRNEFAAHIPMLSVHI